MTSKADYIILMVGSMSMPTPQTVFEWTLRIIMFLVAFRQLIKGVRDEGSLLLYIRSFFKKKGQK